MMNVKVVYKNFLKKFKLMNQYCKSCGNDMGYDYKVSDEDWEKLPLKYHNKVLCLNCFCKYYAGDLNEVDIIFFQM